MRAAVALCLLAATVARSEVRVDLVDGRLAVRHLATGRVWRSPAPSPLGTVLAASGEPATPLVLLDRRADGLRFAAESGGEAVAVTATEEGDAVVFTIDTPDHDVPLDRALAFPPPLTSDLADPQICLAPYGNGLLLPPEVARYRNHTYWGFAADMPFVGLSDGPTGDGYVMILETPYDGGIQLAPIDGRLVPQAVWAGRLGRFAEPRRVRLEFFATGGYVAAAKRYREYARREGTLLTLREKKVARPAVSRLAGAADVWGASAAWAAEAKRLGITAAIVNSQEPGERLAAINALGYLSSRYDNYVDLLEEPDPAKWDNNHGPLDHVARHRDGSLHMGWLTWDKQTQYYQRRSDKMRAAAEAYIAPELVEKPYLARFLDVTTAMNLVENYADDNPYGHEQDMAYKRELFEYVNQRGLVTGGEHGRWWAVPQMDYFEGMMSLNPYFSWPAGHLLKPEEGLAQISDEYREFGLGPARRIPLWELVFGDCVVDYWYWGDTNGYLDEFDPSLSDRKDAFNVLYGTPPMYWVTSLGFGWETEAGRARTLQSYRHTGPWHGEVMWDEMLGHEFLSAERLVQRSTFAGGREAVVNFAAEAREVTVAGRTVTLPPHGFVAVGPRFLAERRMLGNGPATRVRGRLYAAVDGRSTDEPVSVPGLMSDGVATVTVESPERIRIAEGSDPLTLNPAALVEGWDVEHSRLFELDAGGRRLGARVLLVDEGKAELDPRGAWLELATGSETALADLLVSELIFTPEAPEQGDPLTVSAIVANDGWQPVAGGRLRLLVDGLPWAEQPLHLAPRDAETFSFEVDTAALDGPRRFAVVAEPPAGQTEQLVANNRAAAVADIAIDWRRWPRLPAARFRVTAPVVSHRDAVVAAPLQLHDGADPASVRVLDAAGGQAVPSQFENTPANPLRGTLVWQIDGELAPGRGREFDVIVQPAQSGSLRPAGGFWQADSRRIETPVYALDLADGVPRHLRIEIGEQPRRPVITQMVYSSAATGWVDENGQLERLDVLAAGPVRTVVRVERNLADNTTRYARTFTFYADRFEVATEARPSVAGLHHRLYFARGGTVTDSLGRIAALDGKGDAEGIAGESPDWVAVYSDAWALSLVRLEGGGSLSWWDSANLGGLGYSGDPAASRDAFGFYGPQTSPAYAEVEAARRRHPPLVEAVAIE